MPARDVTATIKPADYVSEYDAMPSSDPDYRHKQYTSALALARRPDAVIYIRASGAWGAEYRNEQGMIVTVTAYETLGLHRDTDALIQGWLDGGARILDYRPE